MNYDCIDPKNPEFICRDEMIVIKQDGAHPRYSNIYTPSQAARDWDGAPAATNAAIGSQHGCFCYVNIKITGRQRVSIPNTGGAWGTKAQLTWESGDKSEAWICNR